eukprot:1188149-Prorocentrum_minimum.AAC.2
MTPEETPSHPPLVRLVHAVDDDGGGGAEDRAADDGGEAVPVRRAPAHASRCGGQGGRVCIARVGGDVRGHRRRSRARAPARRLRVDGHLRDAPVAGQVRGGAEASRFRV